MFFLVCSAGGAEKSVFSPHIKGVTTRTKIACLFLEMKTKRFAEKDSSYPPPPRFQWSVPISDYNIIVILIPL